MGGERVAARATATAPVPHGGTHPALRDVVNPGHFDGDAAIINSDEAAGKIEHGKGTFKEKVGGWTSDAELEAEGRLDLAVRHGREKDGTVERKAEETVDDIQKTLNR